MASERGFEFRSRDLEQLVHDGVLSSRRYAQCTRFRPGVFSLSSTLVPIDVHQQQRSEKRLARALNALQTDYRVSLSLSKEALGFTNSLEDALSFLALQCTSEELPKTLRAPSTELQRGKDAANGRGELAAELNVRADGYERDRELVDFQEENEEVLEDVERARGAVDVLGVAGEQETKQKEALSWTQQYVQQLDMQRQEGELLAAGQTGQETLERCEQDELETQYVELLATLQRLNERQSRKKKKKVTSGDKNKLRDVREQLQQTKRQLVARGWRDPTQQVDMKGREKKKEGEVSKEVVKTVDEREEEVERIRVSSDAVVDAELLELAFGITEIGEEKEKATKILETWEAEEEQEEGSSSSVVQAKDVKEEEKDSSGGLFGFLEEAESTVVSANEIKKSAAIDTAAVIAAQAAADLATLKSKKGKNKKGRNMLKVQAAEAQAVRAQSSVAVTWTGKSPRDHLEQHCRKNGFLKPQYKKLPRPSGGGHLYSIILDNKVCGKQEVSVRDARDEVQGFDSISDAKDAVSTSALFELASDLPLYRVLPPVYRDMWQKWTKERQDQEAAAASVDRDEHDELIREIYNTLPKEIAEKQAVVNVPKLAVPHPSPGVKQGVASTEKESIEDWHVDDWDADLPDEESSAETENASDGPAASFEIEEESESDRSAALKLSCQLREQLQKQMRSSAYRAKLQQRESLPIASLKKQVVGMLSHHDVILISGETGCGKSTQVPQYLLEELLFSEMGGARGQIVCTQPRRLAAISLAERVSDELGESNMGAGDSLTGFQIRLETRMTYRTRLLFCTTGILLRKLQDPRTLGKEVSHVIVDEVHERDLQSDVLLAMLRQFLMEGNAVRRRQFGGKLPPLKVILMSATLNAASFQKYFGGAAVCPMIEVPGRTFPVGQFYLEDVLEMTQFVVDEESPAYIPIDGHGTDRKSTQVTISGRGGASYTQQVSWTASSSSKKVAVNETQSKLAEKYSESTLLALERIDPSVVNYELIQALVEHIASEMDLLSVSKEGGQRSSASVLVFLPGLQEITTLLDMLGGSRLLRHDQHGREFELLPLHSSLSSQEQQLIFRQRPGVVRVIAATNIAETSLTIDDVKVVIDTGRVKQMSHDAQRRTNMLDEIWVARANAKQRAGRAGRTSGGSCFRLFPQSVFHSVMLEQPVPEIQRAPLTSLCLQIKTFGAGGNEQKGGCGEFLQACLDPPDDVSIRNALEELFEIGALKREDEALTELGAHLARLPVDVKVGKLLLLGAIFGVFDAASTCAAVLETKSPFVAPFGRQTETKQARRKFAVGASDLLTDVNAYEAWRYVVNQGKNGRVTENSFCHDHFLSRRALRELSKLKRQFRGLVMQLGFLPPPESAGNDCMTLEQLATMSAVLFAGLAPNLVHAEPPVARGPKRAVLRERDHFCVAVHPGSINFKTETFHASNFLTYAVKLHTSQVYLPASSLVLPLAVCLFSHGFELLPQLRRSDKDGNETIGMRVNDWVVFHASFRSSVLVQELRNAVFDMIDASLRTPPYARGANVESELQKSERKSLVGVLRMLFLAEYEERDPKKHLSDNLCGFKQCK
uniref:RNA helicase n=1 Tax=Peronospora matthiolae TaxID=2874970 RepID=A0AAV1TC94_9STRA